MWKQLANTWRVLNLPCEEISLLASRELDGDLSSLERWALRSHAVYCRACRRYRRQIRLLRDVVRQCSDPDRVVAADVQPALSGEARQRLKQALGSSDE